MIFPVKGGETWRLPPDQLARLRAAFAELDVDRELRLARIWLDDHPQRLKTCRGMPRFLSGWLMRERRLRPKGRETFVQREPAYDFSWRDECKQEHDGLCRNASIHRSMHGRRWPVQDRPKGLF